MQTIERATWGLNDDLVAPDLVIHCGDATYTAQAGDGPVTIGREPSARILIDNPRISRTHALVEPAYGGWTLTDAASTNGIFVTGHRRTAVTLTDGATVHLGNPKGVPVTFAFVDPEKAMQPNQTRVPTVTSTASRERTQAGAGERTDPGVARAGAAVAARREELGHPQRRLDEDHIITENVLVAFERGQCWPPARTRAKMEGYLRWPVGAIARIRHGAPPPEDDTTDVLSDDVRAAVAVDAAELELASIKARIDTAPSIADPDFGAHVARLLKDLRTLQATVSNTVRSVKGQSEVVLVLRDVRRTYHDVIDRAARAPKATLGQRLSAARHRAELTTEEAAATACVTVDDVTTAEADQSVHPDAAAALEAFTRALTDN